MASTYVNSRFGRAGSWCLAVACLALAAPISATQSTPALSSTRPLSQAWSVALGPAAPVGLFRFAVCPDSSVVAYSPPGTLYKVNAAGVVEATREVADLEGTRSVDCADVVRVFRVTAARRMQVVELASSDLDDIRRVEVTDTHGFIAGGLRVLHGQPWLLVADHEGGVMARLDGDLVGPRLAVRRATPDRQVLGVPRVPGTSIVVPLFFRADVGRYVYVQTQDYSVVEFDAKSQLHRQWRRADPDFAAAHPRFPGGVVEDEAVVGCAMLPDGTLAMHVVKRRRDGGQSYVELVDTRYGVAGAWSLPTKGMLFGADEDGGLYFADAGQDGLRIWKAHAPV
jgi:hypothetical protein